jgi:hypothetical protein
MLMRQDLNLRDNFIRLFAFQANRLSHSRTHQFFVAIFGIEPKIKPYESSVIPFHHIAIFIVAEAGLGPARIFIQGSLSPSWLPLHHSAII